MEEAVVNLEKQMQKTDEKLDDLATQVGDITSDLLSEEDKEIEVYTLLKSVNEVKSNYQSLHRDIQEVQGLQRELSGQLHAQLKLMQKKCSQLKEKISVVKVPPSNSKSCCEGSNSTRFLISPDTTGSKYE
ncbi:epidermal growth factor receptor substrate 15-like [Onthophagus taurus]|uniref:epidermal growth factor receptor substrate 15-like n=1 Tax=Onthophagus taurus TaxID=166361 RepID=UPI0039BEA4C4